MGDARDHLRDVEIGSAAMRPEMQQRLMALLPRTRICHHYGLTATSRAAFLEYHADREKLTSIGRPIRTWKLPSTTTADARSGPGSPANWLSAAAW